MEHFWIWEEDIVDDMQNVIVSNYSCSGCGATHVGDDMVGTGLPSGECGFSPLPTQRCLWLDDERPEPKGWIRAKTVDEAIAVVQAGNVDVASLDHDLGWKDGDELPSGYKFLLWMAENDKWPTAAIRVHSMNAIGRANMNQFIARHAPERIVARWLR